MSLAEGKIPTGCPVAPPPSAAPPPASSIAPVPGTMPSLAFPYGLDSVAWAYASSVSTSMSAYEELPGHHLRSTLDLVASTPAFEYLDSTECLLVFLDILPVKEFCTLVSNPSLAWQF
jgi:hypothetical protein